MSGGGSGIGFFTSPGMRRFGIRTMNQSTIAPSLTRTQKRSLALITAGALALYFFLRWLPTGTNLNHMDFRVTGQNALEFCDPANPQFIPVIAAKSPVTLTLMSDTPPARGQESRFTLKLRTFSGKPVAPEDLLVAHTQKLHLLIVDPTLSDYQHVHPEPGRRAGEWVFRLAPQRAGRYRVFADFTPVATQRGLYASADFDVPGDVANVTRAPNRDFQIYDLRFELRGPALIQAGKVTDLTLHIERAGTEKKPVPLLPVMGAFAHLVAFDEQRTGFAHLHPQETDLSKPPDALRPELHFKVTITRAGRYVIWAQVNLGLDGTDTFVPFWIDVLP
jgi:hypothetical protein